MLDDLFTQDVSASGLSLVAQHPHGLETGDRLEIRLFARILGERAVDTLVMATDAIVVRSDDSTAALTFRAPLAY